MKENTVILILVFALVILISIMIYSYQQSQSFSNEFCENKEGIKISNQWATGRNPQYITCGFNKGEKLVAIKYTRVQDQYYQLIVEIVEK